MAIMYPKSIAEYMPTDSERIVYQELKNQLPDSFDVFYSVSWTSHENGALVKSEADFIVASPDYGFLCLEVKGGTGIRIEDNIWYIMDSRHGERKLAASPYDQAEKSMYFFAKYFSNQYNTRYQGIYGAGVVFPFYPVGENVNLDNRHRTCTIDGNDLNDVYSKIKKMFRLWGGNSYGRRFYPESQHNAFMELVRERIAISAAAGALVKYKDQQMNVINRVQDNYIYFINNIRQFYIRGGAGTGKTWIAMKMAREAAENPNQKVLFLCVSPHLAQRVKEYVADKFEVMDLDELFKKVLLNYQGLSQPMQTGLKQMLIPEHRIYDAIFVDEAQDFSREWAIVIKELLRDPQESRLGIFYDDVQVLKEESFGDGFGIDASPYLLHENIRNTANIYIWTSEKTKLGRDMIANPVEGPTPLTEVLSEPGQLTNTLETLLRRYLEEESLSNSSIVVLLDDLSGFLSLYPNGIAKWKFKKGMPSSDYEVGVYTVEDFKGLESDMVIYIHDKDVSENLNYIAYTRAKYYLIELVRNY